MHEIDAEGCLPKASKWFPRHDGIAPARNGHEDADETCEVPQIIDVIVS